ncbi:MAG: toxin-antitoxin system YwqK family antitoxin [Planctomycetes bacterium]|nr:toxin-antitoxin system YwqK family antitoxin [Planctomycetota bacterium]
MSGLLATIALAVTLAAAAPQGGEQGPAPASLDGGAFPPRAHLCTQAEQGKQDEPALPDFEGTSVERVQRAWPGGFLRVRRYVERDPQGRDVDHGPDWRWYENGQVQVKRTWRHGRQDGPSIEYWENGFVKASGVFVRDDRDGLWRTWHDDGAPKSEKTWKARRLDGTEREWFKSGVQRILVTWKDGVQHGPYRVWFANGQPSVQGTYDGGVRDGAWTEWAEDGAVALSGAYTRGTESGVWTRRDPATHERFEETLLAGVLEGPRTVFDAAGNKIAAGVYAKNRPVGLQSEWYANGKLKSEVEHADGVPHGRARRYHENGALASEGTYAAGKREGAWSYFGADGRPDLDASGTYHDDRKVP